MKSPALSCLRRMACALIVSALLGPALQAKPEDWKASIDAYVRQDAEKAPPRDCVVFAGSSTIVMWKTLEQDFPGLPIVNRGFGGSEMPDLTYYADQIILAYQPRVVVIYSGENDIGAGKAPERLHEDFRALIAKLRSAQPGLRIIYLGLRPSPIRWALRDRVRRANELIAAECATLSGVEFVDVYPLMVDASGALRQDLFIADRLHMTTEAYALWRPLVAAALNRAFSSVSK